ncbi:MAG: hypothetical protein GY841_24205, partial [FCB group bacterium]|nr:hypothetical protein [FCB group bacterium]
CIVYREEQEAKGELDVEDNINGGEEIETVFERELNPSNVIARMPILGNIAYMSVALLAATFAFLRQFSWRADGSWATKFYANWTLIEADLGSTNYWSLATMVADYSMLGIWATAFVTEILATLGIAASVNVAVWTFGVGLGGLLISLIYNILMFLAIQSCSTINSDSTKGTASMAGVVMIEVQADWISSNAAAGFIGYLLFSAYGNWWASMEAAMDAEEMEMEETAEAEVAEADAALAEEEVLVDENGEPIVVEEDAAAAEGDSVVAEEEAIF